MWRTSLFYSLLLLVLNANAQYSCPKENGCRCQGITVICSQSRLSHVPKITNYFQI
jgi:hypothetical protein